MEPALWRACTAELIATFALCFIGAGSVITDAWLGAAGLLGIALAHGVILAVVMQATGPVSGGHANPAVTFGFLVTGRISPLRAGPYVLSQLAGAVVAGYLLRAIFPAPAWEAVELGAPALAGEIGFGSGIFIEMVLTFLLVFTFFATAVDPRAPRGLHGYAVGLVLLGAMLVAWPLTGAAVNPARTFGPALAGGFWQDHAAYWIGPLLGGMAGALAYELLMLEEPPASAEVSDV